MIPLRGVGGGGELGGSGVGGGGGLGRMGWGVSWGGRGSGWGGVGEDGVGGELGGERECKVISQEMKKLNTPQAG